MSGYRASTSTSGHPSTTADRLRRQLRRGAGPGHRGRDQRRQHDLHVHDQRPVRLVRRRTGDRRGRRVHDQPVQEQPRLPAAGLPHADRWGGPAPRRHAHPVRHARTDEPVLGREPLHVLLHPAQARLRGDRAGQLSRRRRSVYAEGLRERPERGQRPVHDRRVRGRAVRPHGAEPLLDRSRARHRRDHLPHLQERRRALPGAAAGRGRLRVPHDPEHLQLARGPGEHRHDGRIDPFVLRDRPEHGLRLPRGRGRLHPARGRAPGPDRRDRPAGDPDGDQQRGAGRQGPPRLRLTG